MSDLVPPPKATDEELAAAGVSKNSPFVGTERRLGEPGTWRIGDGQLTRYANGFLAWELVCWTPTAIECRRQFYAELDAAFQKQNPFGALNDRR